MKKYLVLLIFTFTFAMALSGAVSAADGNTTLVSLGTGEAQGNDVSSQADISDDGQSVVFESEATNLATGDTNGASDIFLRNLTTNTTTRISVATGGAQGNSDSISASISGNGTSVVFQSVATNLVSGDTNGASDIFLRNLTTNTTTRISVVNGGVQANGASYNPVISSDGRYVVFVSDATNLVANDTNAVADVFLRDLIAGTTTRVSVATGGAQSNSISYYPSINANGLLITFTSEATNLVTGDTNGSADVFLRNTGNGQTTRISVTSSGVQGNNNSDLASINSSGQFITFTSEATNLVTGDTNGVADVFLWNMATGETTRISLATGSVQANNMSAYSSISDDGRYVTFVSAATNLVAGDSNGAADVFLRDTITGQTKMISVASSGAQANSSSYYPSITGDGKIVAFDSVASNLASPDSNNSGDVFIYKALGGVHPGGSIQDAINNASDGDTIIVYDDNGAPYTYHESIVIYKNLIIIASGNVAISGDLNITLPVVNFTSTGSGSTIQGFKIMGTANPCGISLYASNNNNISLNNISGNLIGIAIAQSNGNTITINTITGNHTGIGISSSQDNTVNGNEVNNSLEIGIYLIQTGNNLISGNKLSENPRGIMVIQSTVNTISGNELTNGGISINDSSMCVLKNNIITSTSPHTINLEVLSSDLNGFRQNIDTTNTINGKPIRYLMDVNGLNIDNTWNTGFLALVQCNNITVRGMTIDNAGTGLLLAGTTNSTIGGVLAGQGNSFINNQYGILLYQSSGNQIIDNNVNNNLCGIISGYSTNNTFSGNTVTGNTSDGIALSFSSGNQINGNNQINSNGNCGITLSDSDGNTVSVNTLQNNTNHGINLINSDTNTLSGNTITGNHNNGISLDSSNGNQINSSNQINSNTVYGIGLTNSGGNNISGNTLQNNSSHGINLTGSGTNTISGNTITGNNNGIDLNTSNNNIINGNNQINNNGNYGINLSDSDNNTISSNTLQNNTSYGINLLNADTNTFSGNTITGNLNGIYMSTSTFNIINGNNQINSNHGYGIRLNQANNNTIAGNSVQNNDNYGIYLGSSTTNTISRNTVNSNHNNGIHLVSSNNNIINNDNQINDNQGSGIRLNQSQGNTINDNEIQNNTSSGIYLQSSGSTTPNTISGNTVSGNQIDGIIIYTSNGNIISGNIIDGNHSDGIYLVSSNNTVINGSNEIIGNYINGINLNQSTGTTIEANNLQGSVTGIEVNTPGSLLYTYIHFNRIFANTSHGLNIDSGYVDAVNNWWGSNNPGASNINLISGVFTWDPWIVLTISGPASIPLNGSSTITADLLHDNHHAAVSGVVPYTGPAHFATDKGTIVDANFAGGSANSILNGGSVLGVANVSAAVDNAVVSTPISIVTDTIPPTVTSIDPANKAVNVAANKVIKFTFSETVKAGSNFWVELKNSSGTSIPISKSVDGNVLTITPTNPLAESKYNIVLHTGCITDLAGNPLALYGCCFSVGTSPTITSVDPANNAVNVARDKIITVTFNEPIKKSTNCWVELKASNGTLIPITTSVSGSVLTVNHSSLLAPNTLYSLILHSNCLTDLAGNPVALSTKKFTTTADIVAPTVTSSDPANNQTNIPLDKAIQLTFSENIKTGSMWIELKASNGTLIPITTTINNNILTINHSSLFAANTLYSLILHSGCITDLAGNPLALRTIKFTTAT